MDYEKAMNEYIEARIRQYPNLEVIKAELKLAWVEGARVGLKDAREIYD